MINNNSTENRLQPDDANTLYHNYLNKSQNYLQNIIIELTNSNKIVLENSETYNKLELENKLFDDNKNFIKNEEQILTNNVIINFDDSDYANEVKTKMNVFNTLLNIIGCILYEYQKPLDVTRYFDDFTDIDLFGNIMDFVRNIDNEEVVNFQNHIKFYNYQVGFDFDFYVSANKMLKLFNYINSLELSEDDEDYEQNNLFTHNEFVLYENLKNFEISNFFNEVIYIYLLLDAQLYDDQLKKIDGRIAYAGNRYLLNLVEINNVKMHKFIYEDGHAEYLILDDKMFVHLLTEEQDGSHQIDIVMDKISNIITRGFYHESDGTLIFRTKWFGDMVKNYMIQRDFSVFKDVNVNFESQYSELIN
jgi:hypothetical protein